MNTDFKVSLTLNEGKPLPQGPISYDEFLHWSNDKTFAEWVDGEVILLSPISEPHQDISVFLTRLLSEFAEAEDAGKVLTAPFQMHLHRQIERGREPDIMFLCNDSLPRISHTYLDGPADIAVEIVSPESVVRDRGQKYAEYEMEGVREYWIIDPESQRADFFVLDQDGRYERAHEDAEGIYRSAVLSGFWMNINWLWQRPMPKLREVLRQWEQQ